VKRIGELGTTQALTSNQRTLRGNTESKLGIGEVGTTLTVNSNRSIVFLGSGLRLLVIADIVPNSPIPVTLMMEVILSPELSVLTSATRPNILEDGVLLPVHVPMKFNLLVFHLLISPELPSLSLTLTLSFLLLNPVCYSSSFAT
jgi:hypothetical protein